MFQMPVVFAEFDTIRERVNSGLDRVCGEIERTDRYATKKVHTIKRLGRHGAEPHKIEEAKALLATGDGILKVAKTLGLRTSAVQKLKNEMVVKGRLSINCREETRDTAGRCRRCDPTAPSSRRRYAFQFERPDHRQRYPE
jgi:hypothetical protein